MINLNNKILWMVPLFFFIFLSLFIFFKFIFIFFFRAAFEPSFIFELTPFYVLAGLNNLQLLFLSLIIVFLDTYLHVKATRKNLLYSFIPTSLMLCGSGLGIITHGISVNILLFGLLLFVILIDHRRTLLYPETLAAAQPAEPGPVSEMPQPQQAALGAGRAKPSISAISSIFSIFKRGKKPAPPVEEAETYEEGGTYEEGEPVYEEPVPEGEITEEVTAEPSEEYAPAEPEAEGEEIPAEATEPVPPETQEEQETPAGGGGGGALPKFTEAQEDTEGYKSDSYEYSPISQYQKDEVGTGLPIKDTVAQPLEPSKAEEEDKHREILENVEKLYPPDAELETLKQKITDHKKEIEGKATVLQDVKSDFENIQGGLDSLKNTLESLVGEIQSTVQELTATRGKETRPPQTLLEPRKKTERETTRPTSIPRKRRSVDKRKTSLKKAQILLKELNRRVEKLEHVYIY